MTVAATERVTPPRTALSDPRPLRARPELPLRLRFSTPWGGQGCCSAAAATAHLGRVERQEPGAGALGEGHLHGAHQLLPRAGAAAATATIPAAAELRPLLSMWLLPIRSLLPRVFRVGILGRGGGSGGGGRYWEAVHVVTLYDLVPL